MGIKRLWRIGNRKEKTVAEYNMATVFLSIYAAAGSDLITMPPEAVRIFKSRPHAGSDVRVVNIPSN